MKKKSRSVILFLLTCFVLTSCLGRNASPAAEKAPEKTEDGAAQESSSPSEEEAEAASETPEEASESAPAWADLTFLLEEESLTLPFAFEEIGDTWHVDPENDILAADAVLSPGERTTDTIPIISESWEGMLVSAGFVNLSDRELPLEECSVWSFTMDATWAGEDEKPSLSLPGGLTWGAGTGEIREALGDPSVEPFYSESMYYSAYTYDWKFVRDMEFVIYDEEGLTAFTLSTLDTPR